MTTTLAPAQATDLPTGKGWKVSTAGQSRSDLSKQWLARPKDQRFTDMTSLNAFLKRRWEGSEEARVANGDIEIIAPEPKSRDDLHRLTVSLTSGREVAPTHWAFGQLAGLAGAPAGYLRELPSQIAADCITYGLRHNREQTMVKTFADGESLLAINGPDYGRIPDHEVAAAVMQVAGNGTGDSHWKVPGTLDWKTGIYNPNTPVTLDNTTLFASDRDLFLFLVDDLRPIEVGKLPSGEPDLMFRGFYVENSEVGKSAMRIAAFYLRAICCNRIMWGVEGFQELNIRHTKYAPDRFIEVARPALESYANASTGLLLDGISKAQAAKVASNDEEAVEWLKGRGFNKSRVTAIMEAVEREEQRPARTVWDFAQGITAVARGIENQDDRVDLEAEAGKILNKVVTKVAA